MSSKSRLIRSVEKAPGLEAVGAFIKGCQDKMDDVRPQLDHCTAEQVSTLYELLTAMEGTAALNIARIRRQDAIAAKQQERDKKIAANNGDDGMTPEHKEH